MHKTFWTLLACLPLLSAARPAAACPPRQGAFRVYQGLLYSGMPDLKAQGIAPVHLVDRDFWAGDGPHEAADPAKVRAVAAALPKDGAPIVIDVEAFDLHRNAPGVAGHVRELARIAALFKAAAPGRAIGYYGLFPLADYWRAIDVPPGGAADWRRDNDAAAALKPRVDAAFPSLYTYYRDQPGWVRQARAMVCEARRITGKPVYAFIWPEFHDSTEDAGKPIPPDYWRLQLETLHEIADGVVIWGGYDLQHGKPRVWDGNAAWWRVTREAMARWR